MLNKCLPNIIRITGKTTVSKDKITTLVLEDPDRLCNEDSKEDTEAMFIDPIYNVGYIIQKVRPRNKIKTPVIFKVIKFIVVMSKLRYTRTCFKFFLQYVLFIYLKVRHSFIEVSKEGASVKTQVGRRNSCGTEKGGQDTYATRYR